MTTTKPAKTDPQSILSQAVDWTKTVHLAVEELAVKACDEGYQLTADEWRIVSMAGLEQTDFERRVKNVGKIRQLQADALSAKERAQLPGQLEKLNAENQSRTESLRKEIEERQNEIERLQGAERSLRAKFEKAKLAVEILRETQMDKGPYLPEHVLTEYKSRKQAFRNHPDFRKWKTCVRYVDHPQGVLEHDRKEALRWLDEHGSRMQEQASEIEAMRDLYVPM